MRKRNITRQQHHNDSERERQTEHQRHRDVGNELWPTAVAVDPQLQRLARQVDEPLSHIHACSALRSGAREAGAVGFDEREFVAAGDVGRDRFVEQLRQRDRGADEAAGPPRGQ